MLPNAEQIQNAWDEIQKLEHLKNVHKQLMKELIDSFEKSSSNLDPAQRPLRKRSQHNYTYHIVIPSQTFSQPLLPMLQSIPPMPQIHSLIPQPIPPTFRFLLNASSSMTQAVFSLSGFWHFWAVCFIWLLCV